MDFHSKKNKECYYRCSEYDNCPVKVKMVINNSQPSYYYEDQSTHTHKRNCSYMVHQEILDYIKDSSSNSKHFPTVTSFLEHLQYKYYGEKKLPSLSSLQNYHGKHKSSFDNKIFEEARQDMKQYILDDNEEKE